MVKGFPYILVRESVRMERIISEHIDEHVRSFYDRYANLLYLDIDSNYDVRQLILTRLEEYIKEHHHSPTKIVVSYNTWYKIMTQLTASIYMVPGNNHITKIFGMEVSVDNLAEDNKIEVFG